MQGFEKDIRDFIEGIFHNFGIDPLSAKIIGVLFLDPDEVSMDSLSEATGYCKASILNKTRMLEGIGIIERRKRPGTKKIFFYMDKDLPRIMKHKFEMAYQKEIIPVKERIPKIVEKYKGKKLSVKERQMMEIITCYYDQMLMIDKTLKRFMEMLERDCGKAKLFKKRRHNDRQDEKAR